MPRSIVVVLTGLYASAVLVIVFLTIGLSASDGLKSPEATVIGGVITFLFGATPAVVSGIALVRGRAWAPVVVTIAASWTAYLLVAAGLGLSLLALAAVTCSIVGVWTPTSKQYGRDVRARQNSGLR